VDPDAERAGILYGDLVLRDVQAAVSHVPGARGLVGAVDRLEPERIDPCPGLRVGDTGQIAGEIRDGRREIHRSVFRGLRNLTGKTVDRENLLAGHREGSTRHLDAVVECYRGERIV